jgi:hypothetical protein
MMTYEERVATEIGRKAVTASKEDGAARLLDEAKAVVTGDRSEDYGSSYASFSRIAAMWGAYLGTPVEPRDVAAMMSLLKISRLTTKGKRDSWVDLAGYAALGAAMDEDGKI